MYLKNKTYTEDLEKAFQGTVNIRDLYHKSILITGATGLIGSFLSDLLLYANREEDAGITLYLLARDEKRVRERFASSLGEKRLHFLIQDVVEPLKSEERFDYIIHAAGDGYPAAFRERPVETMTPALFGTYQLLQYAVEHSVERFLYVSSGEVYGKGYALTAEGGGSERAFREYESGYLDSMEVRSCYPMAKRCAETLCVSFAEEYRVPVGIARPGHVYGPCVSARDNRATAQFLKKTVEGEDIVLYSGGKQKRSYTYVADCVSGLLTVLLNGKNQEAYNICSGKEVVTIEEFGERLAKTAGVRCVRREANEKERKESSPIEYAVLDAGKLEGLGWKKQYDIGRGIQNMYQIAIEEKIYRNKRI